MMDDNETGILNKLFLAYYPSFTSATPVQCMKALDGEKMNDWDEPAGTWYTMDDFLQLRKHQKAFQFLCEQFLCIVVGKNKWNDGRRANQLLSKVATVTDEAFCILLVENWYKVWMRQSNLE
jgi:hypothetical protein